MPEVFNQSVEFVLPQEVWLFYIESRGAPPWWTFLRTLHFMCKSDNDNNKKCPPSGGIWTYDLSGFLGSSYCATIIFHSVRICNCVLFPIWLTNGNFPISGTNRQFLYQFQYQHKCYFSWDLYLLKLKMLFKNTNLNGCKLPWFVLYEVIYTLNIPSLQVNPFEAMVPITLSRSQWDWIRPWLSWPLLTKGLTWFEVIRPENLEA